MRSTRRCGWWLTAGLVLLAACGGGGTFGDVGSDAASEVRADVPADAAADAGETQVDPHLLEQKKFALAMFHFNLQYVAGGLETARADGTVIRACGTLCEGWTEDALEDWYIEEAFQPVLDLLLDHPTWRLDLEFQGRMVDVMADRHPEVLDKLRILATEGRAELVSLHWSDQLFLAFPAADLARSVELTRASFEAGGLPLSGVVFNQEGQSGEGKHAFMAGHGYSIDVYPVNLFQYQHQDAPRAPWYRSRGVDVVVGPGLGYLREGELIFETDVASGITTTWTFFDDGDLLAYPPSPYLAPLFMEEVTAEEVTEYEARLEALDADGFEITTVSEYVEHLRAQGVEQPALPPVLDGTWQPIDTDTIWRWMGARSVAAGAYQERDNALRTWNYRARTSVAAAEVLLAAVPAGTAGRADLASSLAAGWRELLLAEVSDTTGITPWPGEFQYGVRHTTAAEEAADAVIAGALAALGWAHAAIDLEAGTAEAIDDVPVAEPPAPAEAPLEITVAAPTRETEDAWFDLGPGHWELRFTYGPSTDPTGKDADACRVTVAFPRTEAAVIYSPGLLEDEVVTRPLADFALQKAWMHVPLANGLIGLGGGWWVIEDLSTVHLAAQVATPEVVEFADATADPVEPQTWVFHVLQGSEADALALARRLNTHPTVYR